MQCVLEIRARALPWFGIGRQDFLAAQKKREHRYADVCCITCGLERAALKTPRKTQPQIIVNVVNRSTPAAHRAEFEFNRFCVSQRTTSPLR